MFWAFQGFSRFIKGFSRFVRITRFFKVFQEENIEEEDKVSYAPPLDAKGNLEKIKITIPSKISKINKNESQTVPI